MTIRPARPDELDLLSSLALRSKGHWGYSPEFLEACRQELTVTPDRLSSEWIRVYEDDSGVVGYVAVVVEGEQAGLVDLFVHPDRIGSGAGRALWEEAVEWACSRGAVRLRIEADPNAEAWYRNRGAVPVGWAPSGSIPGRMLPVLELDLTSLV
jgi:GNAT superfamily N-acetyltransferase